MRNDRVVNSNIFKEECPTAAKVLSYAMHVYKAMIRIYYQIEDENKVNFTASINQIASTCNSMYHTSTDTDTIHRYINVLAYHKMIVKLNLNDLSDDEYEELVLWANTQNSRSDVYKLTQSYRLPYLSQKQLKLVEEQACKWKQYGYSIRSVTYEMFYRREGYEVAASIYPYYKEYGYSGSSGEPLKRSTTKASDERAYTILSYVMKEIKEKGYCLYRNISPDLHIGERQVNKCLPEIIADYGLKKVSLNKELKESLNVPISGYPTVLIPEATRVEEK